jgi:hypothetical protein
MTTVVIASAYRQLQPVEKRFVDSFMEKLELEADRQRVQIAVLLQQPVQIDQDGMLLRPLVLSAITERAGEIAAATEISVDRILREWKAIAFSNIRDYVEFDMLGNPVYDLSKATPEQMAAVKKIRFKQTATGAVELDFDTHDKMRALEVLSKYAGIVEPENPHWRARNATPVLDSASTVLDAADAYARTLEG